MKRVHTRQTGVTLIELMIGVVVGLIVLAGVLSVFVATIKSSSDTLKSSRLNQEIRAAMSLISSDIRRAGFWGVAVAGSCNPFNNTDATQPAPCDTYSGITVQSYGGEAGACILFSYDLDANGAIEPNEYMGYRFDSANSEIDVKTSGNHATNPGLTTDDSTCARGSWEALTDSSAITISQTGTTPVFSLTDAQCLNITDAPTTDCQPVSGAYVVPTSGDLMVWTQEVDITFTGQVITVNANELATSKQAQETVKVRNNLVETTP
jgi:prepilin peptidase dependent protein B